MVLSGEGSDEMFGGYLYFHKAPSREEFYRETVRKILLLHLFDNNRANKATAAWGLEARVPFLDVEFLNYAMQIDPTDKMCGRMGQGRIEKWILRKAFEGYLPPRILWRQKEQFSDGVGYRWINSLRAHADERVTELQMKDAATRFPDNTPTTKEAYLYREIFESHFPQPCARACVPGGPSIACSTPAAILWDESFKKMADPSGRMVVGVHTDAVQSNEKGTTTTTPFMPYVGNMIPYTNIMDAKQNAATKTVAHKEWLTSADFVEILGLTTPATPLTQATPSTPSTTATPVSKEKDTFTFDREKMVVANGWKVEGYWATDRNPKQDYAGKYPFPTAYTGVWKEKDQFLTKLAAIEAKAKIEDDGLGLICYGDVVTMSTMNGSYIVSREYIDRTNKIMWSGGFRAHYVATFNVLPSREFYEYVMSH